MEEGGGLGLQHSYSCMKSLITKKRRAKCCKCQDIVKCKSFASGNTVSGWNLCATSVLWSKYTEPCIHFLEYRENVTHLPYKEGLFSLAFPLGGFLYSLASCEGGSQHWSHRDMSTAISPSNPITCVEQSTFHNICKITSGFDLVAPRQSHLLTVDSLLHDTKMGMIYEANFTFRISCSSTGSNHDLTLCTFPTLWQYFKTAWWWLRVCSVCIPGSQSNTVLST